MTVSKYFNINQISWQAGAGQQDALIPSITQDNKLYRAIIENRFCWAIIPNSDIINYLSNNNYNICEVLAQYPKKVYFDIDGDASCKLDAVMKVIKSYFKEGDWYVSGYESADKNSYHIVSDYYALFNDDDLYKMKQLSVMMAIECKFIDSLVYTKNRNLKCINQSKEDQPKQLIIKGKNPLGHLVCYNASLNAFDFTSYDLQTITPPQQLEQLKLPSDLTNKDLLQAKTLLSITPDAGISHGHRWKVALFSYYNGITEEEYMQWFLKSRPTERRTKKVAKFWNELPKHKEFAVSIRNFRKYLGMWYPELLEETHFTPTFLNSFDIDKSIVEDIKRIEPHHFRSNKKVVMFNIPMGGGKTTTTLQYLKDTATSFIWLAPRQTLVANTSFRMTNEFQIQHVSHLEVGKDKKKLKKANKLLICNQSLHYLEDNQVFDCVVIDEIETALNSWNDTDTHKDNLVNNFNRFCRLLQTAKKILLLDAFITTKTIDFLQSLGISLNHMVIYNNNEIKTKKTMIFNDDYNKTIEKIADDVREGKKVYVFYAFKNATENGHYSITQLDTKIKTIIKEKDINDAKSMDEVKEINKKEVLTYKKSLLYYAESKEKNELGNINQLWSDADYILTTSSITVGVNYEGTDYDKVYLLVSGLTNNPRDVIQSSMRIRKPKEDIIELFLFDTLSKDFKKYPDYYHQGDTVYRNLMADVFIEQQAGFIDSFRKFCSLTGYITKGIPDLKYNKKKESERFVNDMFESKMLIDYRNIEELDEEKLQEYEIDVYSRKASLTQRMAVDRFYFDSRFKVLSEDDRAIVWNNRTRGYFKGIKDPIIKKVCQDNEIEEIKELDCKKIKVSEDTLKYIRIHFSTDIKIESKLVIKAINDCLGFNAIEPTRGQGGKIRGYQFSSLFESMVSIYARYKAEKDKEQAEFIKEEIRERPEDEPIQAGSEEVEAEIKLFDDYKKWDASHPDKSKISEADREKWAQFLLSI